MKTKTWKLTALDNFGGGIVALFDIGAAKMLFIVKTGTPNAERAIRAWLKRNRWGSLWSVVKV